MKKYRTIDLNKWHKTGSGANGDSYLCDDENLMLKLFRKESTEKKAEKEFNMAKKVDSMGIVTAAAYEIVRAGNKFGVIYQNIRNKKSYSRMIADNPERVEEYAKEFAAKAKELHSTPCNTKLFESTADIVKKSICKAKFVGRYKADLYKIAEKLSEKTTCIHGDMQTGNLIRANDVNYWIDLDQFSYGDPKMDIAHMYNIYSCVSGHSFVQKLMHMDQKLLNSFWNAFIKEYYGVSEQETEKIEESLVIYNALDLMQRNVRHPGLLSDMIMLILVRPMVKKYFSGYSQMQSRR